MDAGALALVAGFFALLGVLTAHRYQSWLAPGPLWNMCWATLFLVTALLGYGFDFPAVEVGALIVLASLYNVPGFVLNSTIERDAALKRRERVRSSITPSIWPLLALAAIGLLGAIQVGLELGTSVFAIRSIDELFDMGQQNAEAIFRGEATFSVVVNITFAFLQLGAAIAGVRLVLKPSKGALLATLLLVLVAFLWSSITTQRSYLLVPVVWFASGYLGAAVWLGWKALPKRSLVWATVGGGAILVVVVFLRAIRTGGAAAALTDQTLAPTRLWLAGYVPTFAAWLENSSQTEISFGLLNGIVALIQPLFGVHAVDDAGDGNFYYIGQGLTSNAGTMMMRAVGTGGLIWGGLTVILLGVIGHLVYRRAVSGGHIAAAGYIGVIAATLWSTNAWFFGYGGRVLALLMLIIAVAATVHWRAGIERLPSRRGRSSRSNGFASVYEPSEERLEESEIHSMKR